MFFVIFLFSFIDFFFFEVLYMWGNKLLGEGLRSLNSDGGSVS